MTRLVFFLFLFFWEQTTRLVSHDFFDTITHLSKYIWSYVSVTPAESPPELQADGHEAELHG